MLALKDIQTTVKARIDASSYFAPVAPGVTVACIIDDGLNDTAIETQLRSVGCVVILPPILKAVRRDNGGGKVVLDAEFTVRIMVNPTANAANGGAKRNIYEAIAAAASAVLSWAPTNAGDRRFEASADWLQLTNKDAGLIIYDLFFTKLSTVN